MLEIERKFLIAHGIGELVQMSTFTNGRIAQFYLSTDPERTVRCRYIEDGKNHPYELTIKGPKVSGAGVEINMPMAAEAFEQARSLKTGPAIDKTRYYLPLAQGLTGELDIFKSPIEFAMIEVEFSGIEAAREFVRPDWFGPEVTEISSYQNAAISAGDVPLKINFAEEACVAAFVQYLRSL